MASLPNSLGMDSLLRCQGMVSPLNSLDMDSPSQDLVNPSQGMDSPSLVMDNHSLDMASLNLDMANLSPDTANLNLGTDSPSQVMDSPNLVMDSLSQATVNLLRCQDMVSPNSLQCSKAIILQCRLEDTLPTLTVSPNSSSKSTPMTTTDTL